MLKLTQKPPLTYGMVQWLVVLGTTKRQQQERQKQTSNRFNHMCKTRLNATQQEDDDFIFLFQNLDVVPKNTNPGKYTVI